MIIAIRCAGDRRFILLLNKRRSGATQSKRQNAMHDTGAILGGLHECFVEVHLAIVARDATKHIHIRFANGLSEGAAVAYFQR